MPALEKAKKARGAKATPEDAILGEIQRLYGFMREQGLECLEFSREDFKVRLVRQRPRQVLTAALAGAGAASTASVPAAAAAAGAPALPPGTQSIKSPLMGIFYRAPSPSSPPFMKEGDMLKAGQTLCMIEAMKVFNEVKADIDCKVVKVLVDNGKPVKVGQELFAVAPVK